MADFNVFQIRNAKALLSNFSTVSTPGYVLNVGTSDGKTAWTNTLNVSTLTGTTLGATNANLTNITFSTLIGSSINTSSITTQFLNYSSITGSSISSGTTLNNVLINYSTIQGSTITASTVTTQFLNYSSITGSSISSGTTLNNVLINYSTIQGSTITASTVTTQFLNYSTIRGSSIMTQFMNYSTISGSTINIIAMTAQGNVGNVGIGSTIPQYNLDLTGTMKISESLALSDGSFSNSFELPLNMSNLVWTAKITDTKRSWRTISVSASGQYQVACYQSAVNIYVSADYGNSWTAYNTTSPVGYNCVYVSASGQYQSAGVYGGVMYRSSDYGKTWALPSTDPGSKNWFVISMSSTGQYQSAAVYNDNILVSSNYGNSWTSQATQGLAYVSVCISSSGKYQSAVVNNGKIWRSENYGITWVLPTTDPGSKLWYSIAMSSSGKYQTAAVNTAKLWRSEDFGNTWAEITSSVTANWYSVSMSATGKYQVGSINQGYIYISSDYGVTWTYTSRYDVCYSISISSSGQYISYATSGDYIYTTTVPQFSSSSIPQINNLNLGSNSNKWNEIWATNVNTDSLTYTDGSLSRSSELSFSINNISWNAKDSTRNWRSICMSYNGQYQSAVIYPGYIYISSDYGESWTQTNTSAGSLDYYNICMSSIGQYQLACVNPGNIYLSIDSGASWTSLNPAGSAVAWSSVCMSSTGQYQSICSNGGYIWISNNIGANWTRIGTTRYYNAICMSSSGQYQTAVVDSGNIWRSSDYGVNWTEVIPPDTNVAWASITMSATGQYQTACVLYGQLYRSINYGVSWTKIETSTIKAWRSVSMSATGKYQVASINNTFSDDYIYISNDYGVTWTTTFSSACYGISISSTGQFISFGKSGGYMYVTTLPVIHSSSIVPKNNTLKIGSSSVNWSEIWGTTGYFGTILPPATGDVTVGNNTTGWMTVRTKNINTAPTYPSVSYGDTSVSIGWNARGYGGEISFVNNYGSTGTGGFNLINRTSSNTYTNLAYFTSAALTIPGNLINDTADLYYKVISSKKHSFQVNEVEIANISSTGLSLQAGYSITLNGSGPTSASITNSSGVLVINNANNSNSYETVSGGIHYFKVASNEKLQVNSTGIIVTGSNGIQSSNTSGSSYWMPPSGGNGFYITDTVSNLDTPATTLYRLFGLSGIIYNDFYNKYIWRVCSGASPNEGQVREVMNIDEGGLNLKEGLTFSDGSYSRSFELPLNMSSLTWVSRDSSRAWRAIAMSVTGQYQSAAVENGYIYYSWDYGVTWTPSNAFSATYINISMSASGQYQSASVNPGNIWRSSDYGVTWTSMIVNGSSKNWRVVCMSASGRYRSACANDSYIWYSSDYGDTWTQQTTPAAVKYYNGLCMSASGRYQTALVQSGNIWRSSDYGVNWIEVVSPNIPDINQNWQFVAMSSTGQYQTACVSGGLLYYSIDYGVNWTKLTTPTAKNWWYNSMSSTGKYQVASTSVGTVWGSIDWGKTWFSIISSSSFTYTAVANSSSGEYITYGGFTGNLYTTTVPRIAPINTSSTINATGVINTSSGFTISGVPVGTSTSSYWNLNGSNVYFSTGAVGIGTNAPNGYFDISVSGTSIFQVTSGIITMMTSSTDASYFKGTYDDFTISKNYNGSTIPNNARGTCSILLNTPYPTITNTGIEFNVGSAANVAPSQRMKIYGSATDTVVITGTIRWDQCTSDTTGFYPKTNNSIPIGKAGNRWSEVFASNGVINTSDSKLKDSIPLTYGLKEILQTRTILYKWKNLPDTDPTKDYQYYGLCADELALLLPELTYDEDKTAPIQMNYSEMIPILINAVKEQNETIIKQQKIIDSILNRLSELESKK